MVLNGIDIASWQSGINVGTNGVAADFVIIKATGGTGYVNPDCDRAFQQAIKSGKKLLSTIMHMSWAFKVQHNKKQISS